MRWERLSILTDRLKADQDKFGQVHILTPIQLENISVYKIVLWNSVKVIKCISAYT